MFSCTGSVRMLLLLTSKMADSRNKDYKPVTGKLRE